MRLIKKTETRKAAGKGRAKDARARRKQTEESFRNIYDRIFKRIFSLSDGAIIGLINGLFGKEFPADSSVSFHSGEFVRADLRGRLADIIITVGDCWTFHLEAQLRSSRIVILRIFEYGSLYAISARSRDGALHFPKPAVIYLDRIRGVPEESVLPISFGDQGSFDYRVKNFTYLAHDVEDLDRRKLALLLPFQALRLRRPLNSWRQTQREMQALEEALASEEGLAQNERLPQKEGLAQGKAQMPGEALAQKETLIQKEALIQKRSQTQGEEPALKEAQTQGEEPALKEAQTQGKDWVLYGKLQKRLAQYPAKIERLQNKIAHDIISSINKNLSVGNITEDDAQQLLELADMLHRHICEDFRKKGGDAELKPLLPGAIELPNDKYRLRISQLEKENTQYKKENILYQDKIRLLEKRIQELSRKKT